MNRDGDDQKSKLVNLNEQTLSQFRFNREIWLDIVDLDENIENRWIDSAEHLCFIFLASQDAIEVMRVTE